GATESNDRDSDRAPGGAGRTQAGHNRCGGVSRSRLQDPFAIPDRYPPASSFTPGRFGSAPEWGTDLEARHDPRATHGGGEARAGGNPETPAWLQVSVF